MSIDEQEVRQRLEAVAAQASPPRFSVEDLISRIRRRRARIIAAVSGALLALAGIAVALPIGLSGPGRPAIVPERLPIQLSYAVTVNGQSRVSLPYGQPRFAVAPGENLVISVDVRIPAHVMVRAMWFGVDRGPYGLGTSGPIGVNPILALSRRLLTSGLHTFRMRWMVPAGFQSGTIRPLIAAWTGSHSGAVQVIAVLFIP
jgi:hypothetical protein